MYITANPRVASAQAMATAVVKRPITQQSTSTTMPPLPPATGGKDQSRPVSAVPPAGGALSESWSEYSHYNSKLTIENFDLLKVNTVDSCLLTAHEYAPYRRSWPLS